jgi:hypothetical protein
MSDSSSAFTRFAPADSRKLRKEFGVPRAKQGQFIRETEGSLAVVTRLNLKYERADLRDCLDSIDKTCSSLVSQCQTILWPPSATSWRDVTRRASDRIFQALDFQMVLAKGGSNAKRIRSQFLAKIQIPDDRSAAVRAKDLEFARSLLLASRYPKAAFGGQTGRVRNLLLDLAVALQKAVQLAANMEALPKGRPTADNRKWLDEQLRVTYEQYSGRKATKARTGKFATYLDLCFTAAGLPHADLMLDLARAVGKRPSLKEQRLLREEETKKTIPAVAEYLSRARAVKR